MRFTGTRAYWTRSSYRAVYESVETTREEKALTGQQASSDPRVDRTLSGLEIKNKALFEQMLKTDSLLPTFTVNKLLALMFALLVHSFTLAWLICGLYVLVLGLRLSKEALLGCFFLALICFAVVWALL